MAMKVLLTTDAYFPMVNGVVTSTNNLYEELKKAGHDVKILTLSYTGHEAVDGDIYYLKSMKVGVYPDARVKLPFKNRLIREIITWAPDIIHSQTEFSTMLAAKHIASKLDIPQVHTYHTLYEDYLNYFPGINNTVKRTALISVTRLLLNTFSGVIAPTAKIEEVLMDYGVNTSIYVIPTGIDLKRFHKKFSSFEKEELRSKLGLKHEDKILVYVGRVAEEKNISELIELLPSVMERYKNVKLLIVGGGPYLEKLKLHVKDKGIEENIIFAGMVNPEEVFKYYRIADIFVTASTSETQGLTYLEALCSGCPVVCKYDKCVEGVVLQGINGFAYKKPCEFSEYIVKILSNYELKAKLKKEAEERAYYYSSAVFGENIVDVYNSVLCRSRVQLVS